MEEPLVTLTARFADREAASRCAEELRRHGIEVSLEERVRPDAPGRLSGPVALGAGLGATAGLMAASLLFPPFSASFATGSLVSTLAGAGLGSLVVDMMQGGAAGQETEVILTAPVGRERADAARELIARWQPAEVREGSGWARP